jgi:hypothetical protein
MSTPTLYAPVDGTSEEQEDFSDEIEAEKVTTVGLAQTGASTSWWKLLVMLFVAVAVGFSSGWFLGTRDLASVPVLLPISSCDQENGAVSYNFLMTSRGKEVLEELENTLDSDGPKAVLENLTKLMKDDSQIAASCHPLAHRVGRKAFHDLGFEAAFGGLPGTDDDAILRTCNAAYMHGIIEHYLAAEENLSDSVTFVETTLCNKLMPPKGNLASNKWECEHGIGHGIVQHVRAQKEKETLVDALTYCKNTNVDTETCQNGIWMDYFASTRMTNTMLEPESLKICSDFSAVSIDTWDCLIYAPTEYLLHNPRDYVGAIQFCRDGLKDPTICIKGVGSQAGKENMLNFLPVEKACLSAGDSLQKVCFIEALNYYRMSSGLNHIPASLCHNLDYFKDQCLNYT